MSSILRAAAVVAAVATGLGPAQAQDKELTIGLSGAVVSMDPHYIVLSSNAAVTQQIFDSLIRRDPMFAPVPALALSWKAIEPQVWELKLRPGVVFSDGSSFDAADVVASIERIPTVPNSPSAQTTFTHSIKSVEAVDPLTVRIHTHFPNPILPMELTEISIIPSELKGATTAEFNSGKAVVSSGPYMLEEYLPNNRVVLKRNPTHWGEREPWSRVTMRIMPNNGARMAALLAGNVDLIENVPPADVPSVEGSDKLKMTGLVSNRVIYLMIDHGSDQSPYITGKDGKPLAVNPLRDLRVRQALSISLNREAIAQRTLSGQATPAGQLLPNEFFGTSKDLGIPPYDPNRAKQLLADAGYPDGFRITLHGPNDRYLNDSAVLQAVAQMFTRIGVEAKVETMPWAAYRPRLRRNDFSIGLFGWGSNTGETGPSMNAILGTKDAKGRGVANEGRYSNAKLDALIAESISVIDNEARRRVLVEATEVAMKDLGLIPIIFPMVNWAHRADIRYTGTADQYTMGIQARPIP